MRRLEMNEHFDCCIRVSTQEQTTGFSLETQQEIGEKISKKMKLKFRLRKKVEEVRPLDLDQF